MIGGFMLFEIKSRWNGEVIFKLECGSLILCVEVAIKSGANLSEADLYRANLSGANLYGVNLSRADLYGADLSSAKDVDIIFAQQKICPTEGAFVGWKKLRGDVIAKLVIPHDAERINSLGSRKCRASKVFVHELYGASEGYDKHAGKTLYKQGCEVVPDKFDADVRVECSHGIHFFITREEAENY